MDFLEKDLEEIIYNTPTVDLWNRHLFLAGKRYRQLNIGSYGVADLVFAQRTPKALEINVVELKKDKIGISAFLQAIGYARGIKRYLEFRNFSFEYNIRVTLIGRTFDKNSTYSFLADVINDFTRDEIYNEFLENYTYNYGLNGIIFEKQQDYSNVNETWIK